MSPERPAGNRGLVALFFVGVFALYLGQLSGFPLQDPDEGRYAEIAREMVETGDWVTPHLNYVSYFHKPPLLYWSSAAALRSFGQTEWAARLPVALAAILTIALTWALGRRMFGNRAALLGAGVLATTPLFFVISQALVMDLLLTACVTAALGSVYMLAHESSAKRAWAISTAFWVGLAFLAKGPIGGVLVGLVTVPFLVVRRDAASFLALLGWRPILVLILVVAPWFVLVSLRNPDFLEVFFVEHHLKRFAGEVGHKEEGLFYFVPVLLGGAAPWTIFTAMLLLRGDARSAWSAAKADADGRLLLWLWAGVIVVFFSLSGTKLPTYVVPALPPLALLLGAWLDGILRQPGAVMPPARWLSFGVFGLGLVLLVVALGGAVFEDALAGRLRVGVADVSAVVGPVAIVGAIFAAGGAAVLFLGDRPVWTDDRVVATLLVTVGLGLFFAIPGREVVKTSRDLAAGILGERTPGDVVVAFDHFPQGLPFYLEQRVVLAGDAGELAPGAAREPDAAEFFWDMSRLVETWESGRRMFVLTDVRRLHELPRAIEPQPRVLSRDLKRVVLVNFAPEGPSTPLPRERLGPQR